MYDDQEVSWGPSHTHVPSPYSLPSVCLTDEPTVVPGLVRHRIVDALMALGRPAEKHEESARQSVTPEEIRRFADMLVDDLDRSYLGRAFAIAERFDDPDTAFEALFEPAARLVGEGWRADTYDFFKVTIALSRLQRLLRQFSIVFPKQQKPIFNKSILLMPSPGEQHNFGLTLVAERFRRHGWHVDHRGETDEALIRKTMSDNDYRIVGFSLSAERLLSRLASTISSLRSTWRDQPLSILVGGRCFADASQADIDKNLGESGADFAASSATDAIFFAESCIDVRMGGRAMAQT